MQYLVVVLSILFTFFTCWETSAAVIFIPGDYDTIQEGIDSSENGDTVLVSPGRYVENISFYGRNIVLGSLVIISGEESYRDSTIIDGDHNGRSTVVFGNEETSDCRMIGFTIEDGLTDYGGGIYLNGASPELSCLIITGNAADNNGGGIYCKAKASPAIKNCIIERNIACYGGGVTSYSGANPTLEDVAIRGNTAQSHGGGIQCSGASISLTDVSIRNNRVSDDGDRGGGGIFCNNYGWLEFNRGEVIGNSCNGWYASGIYVRQSYITMTGVLIYGNSGSELNHTIYLLGSNAYFNNLTIVDFDNWQDVAIDMQLTDLFLTNSIIWYEEGLQLNVSHSATITYCDIMNGEEGITGNGDVFWEDGNLDETPGFKDVENNDYSLSFNSPCIDAGDPDAPYDPDSTRCDMGAIYFDHRLAASEAGENQPGKFAILSAFPNPFNMSTSILFETRVQSNIELRILDICGREISTLVSEQYPAGRHAVAWRGDSRPAGMYFVVLESGSFRDVKRLTYLR